MYPLFPRKHIAKAMVGSVLATALLVTGCTNPTSTAGKVSYFTEGVINDIEYITLDQDHYNTTKTAAVGGVVGAAAGQAIGGNTKATLIGAGIGAIISAGAAMLLDRSDQGARLTVNTNQGLLLVDQPYSCDFKKGAKIRMINQSDGTVQVQVYTNGSYRTAQKGATTDCPLN